MSASASSTDGFTPRVVRFAAVGGANTLATSAAFYALTFVLPPAAAFTLVVAGGLAFVAAVTPGYVFGTSPAPSRRALLVCWYATTWLAGLGVIALYSAADMPRAAVVVGTVAVTAPLNFLGGWLLVGRR
jgi:putative flippase GtrA